MARPAQRQLEFPTPRNWGGRRKGAGRKLVASRRQVPHRRRPDHHLRHPVHVTMRARPEVASLRSSRVFPSVRDAISRAEKPTYRVIHFSVLSDHVHLIAEADDRVALSRGQQGLAVRNARAINRALHRRGKVWQGRYHAHALKSPTEARVGIVYVRQNFRKHLRAAPGIDPCSSGPYFRGWTRPPPLPEGRSPVAGPSGARGWLRGGGPIDTGESPAGPSPARTG